MSVVGPSKPGTVIDVLSVVDALTVFVLKRVLRAVALSQFLVSFVRYIEGVLRLRVLFSQMLSRVHTRRVKETRPQAKPALSETALTLKETKQIHICIKCKFQL